MSKQAKILVIDDEPELLDVYSRLLEAEGYAVARASGGEEGIRLAAAERPDLILLDVVLPDITGIEVCRRLKADSGTAKIFVVLVSGSLTSADSQADGLEAGADGYLMKPVQRRILLAQVRAFLRIERAESALVDQQERELDSLGLLPSPSQTSVASEIFGAGPLSETVPDLFEDMVRRYGALLDLSVEERVYKVEHALTEGVDVLVQQLGFLRAGPRDVIEIHSRALKEKTVGANRQKTQAFVEEGRLTALKLMGHLVSYYRNRSLGARKHDPPGRGRDTTHT